jgi:hypothetical protein
VSAKGWTGGLLTVALEERGFMAEVTYVDIGALNPIAGLA